MQPVGVFLFHRQQGELGVVDIDYVTKAFRDMKTAHWFFGEGLEHLRTAGIRGLTVPSATPAHQAYLRMVGFTRGEDGAYTRFLSDAA